MKQPNILKIKSKVVDGGRDCPRNEIYFLGVDIAGERGSRAVALPRQGRSSLLIPEARSLESLVSFCEEYLVAAVAIDAPLTFGLRDEKGFREADLRLRSLLPPKARSWVVSYHGLQAVPIRGKILAEALSPLVGTVLETHPRASLYFLLPEALKPLVFLYKPRRGIPETQRREACARILEYLSKKFHLRAEELTPEDGLLDALVCALTARVFHQELENLLFLSRKARGVYGRGPFVVFSPSAQGPGHHQGQGEVVV